jgi:chemotaxis protein methyltransferase CheR
MDNKLLHDDLQRSAEFVAATTGLDFPPPRWSDMQRGFEAAAIQLGFKSVTACSRWFTSGHASREDLESLACHLTIGETYFFRDQHSFEILAKQILPALIRSRQNTGRRLRIWSAACCTGEEAYSIAILLRQVIPEVNDWDLQILATDINPRFLRKAVKGVYGQWSFRNAPAGLQHRYFNLTTEGKFEILPEIKRMVTFTPLNLVEDIFPSSANGTSDLDIIFCRNVLMYFTAPQAKKVIEKLHSAGSAEGWLLLGPSEMPHVDCPLYTAVNFQGSIFYGKGENLPIPAKSLKTTEIPLPEVKRPPRSIPANPVLPAPSVERPPAPVATPEPQALRQLALALANQGKLAEALACCDRWIAVDRLNSSSHYLRAVILQEQGVTEDAIRSFRGALYLDPDFVLAHFAMGSLARKRGDFAEAERHLGNAKKLLRRCRSDAVLAESEGVTAGRFIQMIDSLMEMEVAA